MKVHTKVKMRNTKEARRAHEIIPSYYPAPGTIGEIVEETSIGYLVKWPEDSGVTGNHCRYVHKSYIIELK